MFGEAQRQDMGVDMLNSLHECETEVGRQFFGPQNIARIQASIKSIILEKTGHIIGDQSTEALLIVMRAVYAWHAQHDKNVRTEIPRLNAIVLSEVVPNIATNISQYAGYIRDASRLPTPINRPTNESIKGRNTLEPFRNPV